ncbi:hypothetical protein HHI36_001918 [Cryptolaemus montrouzieri]|uniref:Uncharacterized protein n=1 Tax=Cryptolaemus montrouzieri TaxID=559131 RepID=A0ABD2P9N1_9CUCU
MGKALKSTTSHSSNTLSIKSVSKKKTLKFPERKNIINDYLRSLSNNFGSSSSRKKIHKRKREAGECASRSLEQVKKPRLLAETKCSNDIICKNKKAFKRKFEYKKNYLQSDEEIRDLFYIDEIKNNSEHTFYIDWFFHICDEISLEGLDGITLEGLWSRLKNISPF